MKKNKKKKELTTISVPTEQITTFIKPFEYDANSITQWQYDQSCTLNDITDILEATIDRPSLFIDGSDDTRLESLYYDRLYCQMDRADAMAIKPVVEYTIKYVLALFHNVINNKLAELMDGEQRTIVSNVLFGKYFDMELPEEIRRLYNSTVYLNLDRIVDLYLAKRISKDQLEVQASPFITLFATNVSSTLASRLFDGIYAVSLIYPEYVSLFDDINEQLAHVFKELSLNFYKHFTDLTMVILDKEINARNQYDAMVKYAKKRENNK